MRLVADAMWRLLGQLGLHQDKRHEAFGCKPSETIDLLLKRRCSCCHALSVMHLLLLKGLLMAPSTPSAEQRVKVKPVVHAGTCACRRKSAGASMARLCRGSSRGRQPLMSSTKGRT